MKKPIKQTWQELSEMTSVRQLVNAIPEQGLETIALVLLSLWCLSPVFMVFAYYLIQQDDPFLTLLNLDLAATTWAQVLQILGNLGVLVGLVAVVKNHFTEGLLKTFSSKALAFSLLLMLIWSMIATAVSSNRLLAFFGDAYRREGLLTYLAYTGIFACAALIRNQKKIELLLASFGISSMIVSAQYLLYWRPEKFGSNYSGIFLQFNHTAYYFLFATFINLTLILITPPERRFATWCWYLSYGAAIAALLVNNSFGPFLAAVGGMVLVVIFRPKKSDRSQNRRLVVALALFVLISAGINLWLNGIGRDTSLFFRDIAKVTSGDQSAGSAGSGRWLLWTVGAKLASERPWFGYGPDCLGQPFIEHGVTYNDRPHNEFIYFAASLGIPALLFYIAGLIFHLRNFLVNWKKFDWLTVGIFCTVGAYLVNSLFSNTMFYTFPFFLTLLGLSFGQIRQYKP